MFLKYVMPAWLLASLLWLLAAPAPYWKGAPFSVLVLAAVVYVVKQREDDSS